MFRKAAEGEYLKEDYYHIVGKQEFYEKRYVEPHMTAIWGWNGDPLYMGQKWYDDVVVKRGITDLRHLPKDVFDPTSRLLRLQRLSGLDLSKVEFSQMDYHDYEHKEGDVVYCDPPYKNTDNRYGMRFDTDRFWEWVRTRDYPVYVSEYKAPDDFVSIWSKKRGGIQAALGRAKNTTHIEHLFLHNTFLKR